jgi:muramoyltetrapeptide carboxypeptidase
MALIKPRSLEPGDHVAVLAISSPSEMPRIHDAVRHMEAMGLRVTLAPNVGHVNQYLAGPDDERVETLNQFMRSDAYDAFLFARGGYGAMRILDRIDYDAIARNPRPIIGFSDITALHQAIAVKCNLGSFHGPMVNLDFYNTLSPSIEQWFWSILGGDAPLTHRFDRSQVIVDGHGEGPLFGGCLSLTTALIATPYDYWIDDGIWFWEDIDESLYRVDRMLTHLRLSGRFDRIRGVIVGKLKGCGSAGEVDALLRGFFGPLSIPVVRDIPFGHHGDNLVMPIGPQARLDTAEQTMTILTSAVERP